MRRAAMRRAGHGPAWSATPSRARWALVAWALLWYLLAYDRRRHRRLLALGLLTLLLGHLPAALLAGRPLLRLAPPTPAGVVHRIGRAAAPGRQRAGHRAAPRSRSGGPPAAGPSWPGRPPAPSRPAPPAAAALAPNPAGLLAAPPSVAPHAVWEALHAAGSPLADARPRRAGRTLAQYLWERGRRAGLDPAVALALFWHESHYGTLGIAVLTHSLSNRRPVGAQPARCDADGCYADERDWFAGIDQLYALLRQYRAWGLRTVDQLIPVWAPAADGNDVAAFVGSVHQTLRALYTLSHKQGG